MASSRAYSRDKGRGAGRALRGVMLGFGLVMQASPGMAATPQRVMSLDYCADQYVVALADPDQVVALSAGADGQPSNVAGALQHVARRGDGAEDIAAAAPDLVLRVWGGGFGVGDMAARMGLAIHTIPPVYSYDDLVARLRETAALLGHADRAERMIAAMEARFARVRDALAGLAYERRPGVLYLTPNGFTTGPGTLIHDIMERAGLRNVIQEKSGWQPVELENLVTAPPETIVFGFHDLAETRVDHWRLSRHAVFAAILNGRPAARVSSRLVACPTWAFLDAIDDIFTRLVAPKLADPGSHSGRVP